MHYYELFFDETEDLLKDWFAYIARELLDNEKYRTVSTY